MREEGLCSCENDRPDRGPKSVTVCRERRRSCSPVLAMAMNRKVFFLSTVEGRTRRKKNDTGNTEGGGIATKERSKEMKKE